MGICRGVVIHHVPSVCEDPAAPRGAGSHVRNRERCHGDHRGDPRDLIGINTGMHGTLRVYIGSGCCSTVGCRRIRTMQQDDLRPERERHGAVLLLPSDRWNEFGAAGRKRYRRNIGDSLAGDIPGSTPDRSPDDSYGTGSDTVTGAGCVWGSNGKSVSVLHLARGGSNAAAEKSGWRPNNLHCDRHGVIRICGVEEGVICFSFSMNWC